MRLRGEPPAGIILRFQVQREFDLGGVRWPRPFRIRLLGHFGLNVAEPEASRDDANCPETVCGAADTYLGEPFLGPLG